MVFRLRLPCESRAVAAARGTITNVAGLLGVDQDVATLVASELVTNAVRHASTGDGMVLSVYANRACWFVEVVDHAPTLVPQLPHGDSCFAHLTDDATSGRGLPLIVLLGGTLEVHSVGQGRKAVSATLDYEPGI
ncbi:ATP-binding protein [Streptodolium elevatio]